MNVPPAVENAAAGEPLRPAWENELGGLTFEVVSTANPRYIKWVPAGCSIDLGAEAARLQWAAGFTNVPTLLGSGSDVSGSWVATAALPGDNAVSDYWKRDPARAVTAIGRGLRAFHDSLPVASCPFSWSAEGRRAEVRQLAADNLLDPRRWHSVHQSLSVESALAQLSDIPAIDRLVVCHGDACAPNTLLKEDGVCSGHVDLGALGVADRWADLAIATWSTVWNYGPGWEELLLASYGVAADHIRTAYYRLLWDLAP